MLPAVAHVVTLMTAELLISHGRHSRRYKLTNVHHLLVSSLGDLVECRLHRATRALLSRGHLTVVRWCPVDTTARRPNDGRCHSTSVSSVYRPLASRVVNLYSFIVHTPCLVGDDHGTPRKKAFHPSIGCNEDITTVCMCIFHITCRVYFVSVEYIERSNFVAQITRDECQHSTRAYWCRRGTHCRM